MISSFVALGSAAVAETVKPMDVIFNDDNAVEKSLTGVPGDVAKGRTVFSSKKKGNCVACHAAASLEDIPFHGEVGPSMDGVGDRWSEAELRGILVNAKKMFDGTVMPAFYKVDGFNRLGDRYTGKAHPGGEVAPLLPAQDIEDVIAWLKSQTEE